MQVSKPREDFLRKVEGMRPLLRMMQAKMLQETRIHTECAHRESRVLSPATQGTRSLQVCAQRRP